MGQNLGNTSRSPPMHLRLIALTAALCACQAGAASLQPVEAGLQPVYERLATIEAEKQTLKLKLQERDVDAKSRDAAYLHLQEMDAETHRLEDQIEKAKAFARAPLVMFAGPPEQRRD